MKLLFKLALVCVVTCLCLVSCKDGEVKDEGNADNQTEQQENVQQEENAENDERNEAEAQYVDNLSKQAVDILSKVPEYPGGYPTLADAASLYKKANMAIGWIISTEPVAVYENNTITVDGLPYKKVRPDCFYGAHALSHHKDELKDTQKLIFDLDSLEAYLKTLVSAEEAKNYMEDARDLKKFTEDKNGNLYVMDFSYVPQGYGEETYTLDDNGDGTYTFNVSYQLVDEDGEVYKERVRHYDLVKNEEGRWVFDEFIVIRQ